MSFFPCRWAVQESYEKPGEIKPPSHGSRGLQQGWWACQLCDVPCTHSTLLLICTEAEIASFWVVLVPLYLIELQSFGLARGIMGRKDQEECRKLFFSGLVVGPTSYSQNQDICMDWRHTRHPSSCSVEWDRWASPQVTWSDWKKLINLLQN